MAIDVALAVGDNGASVDGRLSLLAQFGSLRREDSRASGFYPSAGVELTTGGLCASSGDDYCGEGWRNRTTLGPTARYSWGRGRGAGDKVFPLFSVYAKATPFVSFHRGDTGAGARLGIGLNAPGASRDLLDTEDDGDGQAGSLEVLFGLFAAAFTHLEIFAEAERRAGDGEIRFGAAFGFGL
jgi:hypothetical protein